MMLAYRSVPKTFLQLACAAAFAFGISASFAAEAPELLLPSPHIIRSKQPPLPEFPPCSPVSEVAPDVFRAGEPQYPYVLPQLDFCAEWNPEFTANGNRCCGKMGFSARMKRKLMCATHRRKWSYCSEMTPEQVEYTRLAEEGKLGDVLELIGREAWLRGEQTYCSVNNGFLAWGRALLPNGLNRIEIRAPDRCANFGTDPMIGLLEWVGRQIGREYPAPEYSGTKLVVGDISAPRGGCLSGRSGRRGHLSHTTGQDVDTAFLVARKRQASPSYFHRQFDVEPNWWFLKKVFRNPFACVKVVFIDKKLIRKLAKSKLVARDPEWENLRRFIRHMPGHKHHFHIRVGDGPGEPGCAQNPELEIEDYVDELDESNSEQDMAETPRTEKF